MSTPEPIDLIVKNLIKQAGVDYEARPMLLFSACYLPDPKLYDYDGLLELLLLKLDNFVENDYVVILLTGGGDVKPGWRWFFKAYRALNRNYRKNLKNLYVVHPNSTVKLIMDTMKAVISPKFAKKLVQCPTLSSLAALVPYRQLAIPEAVLKYNLKFETSVIIPPSSNRNTVTESTNAIFGVSLEQLMGNSGENGLPLPITRSVEYIRREGMEVEGVFRRSPSSVQLKQVKAQFDQGSIPNFSEFDSPVHLAAVTIKLFLRDLPKPLIPESLQQELTTNFGVQTVTADSIKHAISLISKIPKPNDLLLMYLLVFFNDLTSDPVRVQLTKMGPSNLGIVIGPNIIRCQDPIAEMEIARCAGSFIRVCLENYDDVISSSSLPSIRANLEWARGMYKVSSKKLRNSAEFLKTFNAKPGLKSSKFIVVDDGVDGQSRLVLARRDKERLESKHREDYSLSSSNKKQKKAVVVDSSEDDEQPVTMSASVTSSAREARRSKLEELRKKRIGKNVVSKATVVIEDDDSEEDDNSDDQSSATLTCSNDSETDEKDNCFSETNDSDSMIGILVQMLASECISNGFIQEVKAERDPYFLNALRKIEESTVFKRKSVIQSSIWTSDFQKAIDNYPLLVTKNSESAFARCEACDRKDRHATIEMIFSGEEYDLNTLLTRSEKEGSNEKSIFQVGRFCFARASIYHSLKHYKYLLFQKIKAKIENIGVKGDHGETVMTLLNDSKFMRDTFEHYQRLMNSVERYLTDESSVL